LFGGKFLALCLAGIVATLPATVALLAMAAQAAWPAWLLMFLGHGLYLVVWTFAVLLVSTVSGNSGAALRFLLGAWAVLVILLPRLAPEAAVLRVAAPSRFQTEFAIQQELRGIGDSHDEADPYFAGFRQQVLKQYGVERVEDLPVNYKGLLAVEGERLTSELFDRHAAETFEKFERQAHIQDAFAWVSPLPAIRRLSMAAAQTDLAAHRRFIEQAERHRFDFVQRLNRLQAEAVTFADDAGRDDPERERRTRIDPRHWREIPDFRFLAEAPADTVRRALPSFGMLLAWVLVLAVASNAAWVRAARAGR
jgi:ABC-2 type transport system permease protein